MPEPRQDIALSREELLLRYQRRIYGVIYRMTGRHSEVEDLFQETFLQIFRSLARFREGSDLDAWIYRIAMNVSVDYIRRRSKERGLEERLKIASERADAGRPADPEMTAAVRKALNELPPEQKAVVVLRMFENLSHERIAEILETPVATVRWRLFAARQKLEELLAPQLGS